MKQNSILPFPNENPHLQAALRYANLGWRIFPLAPGTKRPLFKDSWVDYASSNPETVRAWWETYPDANIACLTQEFTVIDVDRKPGKPDGWEQVGALVDQGTPWAATANGGYHFLYRDPGVKLRQLPGVDPLQGNHYFVAPPSTLAPEFPWENPKEYRWGKPPGPHPWDDGLRPLSGALLERVRAPSAANQSAGAPSLPAEVPERLLWPWELPTVNVSGWQPHQRAYWEHGDYSGYPTESHAVHGMSTLLYLAGLDDTEVLSLLWGNKPCGAAAFKENHNNARTEKRALEWLWESCKKTRDNRIKQADEVFSPLPMPEVPEYRLWVAAALEKRRAARGTQPEPTGGMTSFADLNFEGGHEYAVDDLIQEQGVGVVYGPPGAKKSFLMVDLAACVATGRAFHGHETNGPGLAVYLAAEGEHALKYRFEAWRRAHEVDREAMRPVFMHGYTDLMESETVKDLIDQAAYRAQKLPNLIVVDTLSKFLSGDENSAKDMNAFLRQLVALSQYYGCVVLMVHHSGHADSTRGRGSSALRGGVDFEFQVEDTGKLVLVQPGKAPKDGEPPEKLGFIARRVTLRDITNRKGQPVTSLVLHLADAGAIERAKDGRKDKTGDKQERLMAFLVECSTLRYMMEIPRTYIWENCTDINTGKRLYARSNHLSDALEGLRKKGLVFLERDVVKLSTFPRLH